VIAACHPPDPVADEMKEGPHMSKAMHRFLTVALALTVLVGRPAISSAHENAGREFSLAISAAAANLLYTPAKVIVAIAGMAVGGLTGVLTGDTRAQYGVLVPAASGTYALTPAHLEGREPIEFFGTEYADRPSTYESATETGQIYEAQYSR
jgi:hypothetical protein